MRYLIFGDVHGNLEALEAVLAAAERHRVDAFLFVGDLVGYGPSPLECIQRLQQLHAQERLAWAWGNHDRVARGELQPDGYNAEAVETLRWTQQQVREHPWALDFLATGQLVAKITGGIWLTHDSLVEPGSGYYHRGTENAEHELEELCARGGKVCFYGHTHTMRAELMLGGAAVMLVPLAPQPAEDVDPTPLRLPFGDRAWVGSGSTGFPKHKKGAAEFLVLDDQTWVIEKYAVAYPREQTKQRVRATFGGNCSPEVVERIVRWL